MDDESMELRIENLAMFARLDQAILDKQRCLMHMKQELYTSSLGLRTRRVNQEQRERWEFYHMHKEDIVNKLYPNKKEISWTYVKYLSDKMYDEQRGIA